MKKLFIESRGFTARVIGLLTDDEYADLQCQVVLLVLGVDVDEVNPVCIRKVQIDHSGPTALSLFASRVWNADFPHPAASRHGHASVRVGH